MPITYAPASGVALTFSALATLANNTYDVSNNIDLGAATPLDVLIWVALTPGSVSGNTRAVVFAQFSMNGTDWTTGPTSGTTATDEVNLIRLGEVPLKTNSTLQRNVFSLAATGMMARYFRIVVRNESGTNLSAGTAHYQVMPGT